MAENKWVSLGLFHPETSGAKWPPTYTWIFGPTSVRIYILPEDSDTLTSLTGWQCDGIFFTQLQLSWDLPSMDSKGMFL